MARLAPGSRQPSWPRQNTFDSSALLGPARIRAGIAAGTGRGGAERPGRPRGPPSTRPDRLL